MVVPIHVIHKMTQISNNWDQLMTLPMIRGGGKSISAMIQHHGRNGVNNKGKCSINSLNTTII
jgi:hypothetical protein